MSTLDNAYAIIIGVGADLPASVRDAKAIRGILANPDLAGYKEENITLLIEEAVTRDNILNAFDTLHKKMNTDSSVILFYSGHGGTYTDNDILELEHKGSPLKPEDENESHYYFVPNNFDPNDFRSTWLLATELKEKIRSLPSRRLILFLDCCHAEGMTKAGPEIHVNELKDRLSDPEGMLHRIDSGQGISIVSSCRAEELSWIIPKDAENSLFTNCLLEVLQGEHKENFDEPYIRMTDVINYVMRKVPELQPVQRPFVNLNMYDDFILSKLPNSKKERLKLPTSDTEGTGKAVASEVVSSFRNENAANVILFVHGFSGEAADSFGAIPEYIQQDLKMQGWDLFPLGYSENVKPDMGRNIWASVTDIMRITDNLVSAIRHKFNHYKRIAVVGHSLGGLVVQRALLDLKPALGEKISHVFLFGTPSNGIASDTSDKVMYKRLAELDRSANFISNLRTAWRERYAAGYPFNLKVVVGTEDADIPLDSALEPFDPVHHVTIAGNHFSMVQPKSIEHDGYRLLVDTLTGNEFHLRFTSEEAINNLLGEYDTVIKKLLPTKDSLRAKGLKQLLFALEGMDRHDEALDILLNHPTANENSDLLGILGGRYKRKYLASFSEEDGRLATEYYEKGLAMASEQNNKEQAYYHGINLAFLSLVYDEDKQAMREYAQQALEDAQEDPFDSIWKLATLGEAYLYLADFENAKKYYGLAAEGAGIREKLSIHTNAYMAYTTLMNTTDDAFITFMKVKFLS